MFPHDPGPFLYSSGCQGDTVVSGDNVSVPLKPGDDLFEILCCPAKKVGKFRNTGPVLPGTPEPVHLLEEILPELDFVLLMTVNPGWGGQRFIPSSRKKIRSLRRTIRERGLEVLIEIGKALTVTGPVEPAALGKVTSFTLFYASDANGPLGAGGTGATPLASLRFETGLDATPTSNSARASRSGSLT